MGKNKTIYLRTGIAEKLEGMDAGPLINDLLQQHFNKVALPLAKKEAEFASVGIRSTKKIEFKQTPAGTTMTGTITPNPQDVADFKERIKVDVPHTLAKKIASEQPSEPAVDEEDLERPCCANKAPCQHWQWDGDAGVWRNTLSNRERQP